MELPDELDELFNSGKPFGEQDRKQLLEQMGIGGTIDKEAIRKKIEDRFLTLKPTLPAHWLPDFQVLVSLFSCSSFRPDLSACCLQDAGRINWTSESSFIWRHPFHTLLWSFKLPAWMGMLQDTKK